MSDKSVTNIVFNIEIYGATYIWFGLKGLAIAFCIGAVLTMVKEFNKELAKAKL